MRSASYFLPIDEHSHPLRRRWLGTHRYWLFQIGGWGLFWLVLILGTLTSDFTEAKIRQEIAAQSLFVASFAICSHLLRVFILYLRRRKTTGKGFLFSLIPAVTAAGAAVVGPWTLLGVHYGDPADLPNAPANIFPYLVFLLVVSLMLGVWVCFYFGYHYYQRYQQGVMERLRLDAAVKESELRALRSQVNPHFLFNSLNTMRALIPRELDRPREAITLLADLLRAGLTVGQQQVISLAQELETVENYLALEQLRFEKRLSVQLAIAPETPGRLLPPFVLQTLVENAIKFGVAPFEEGGVIEIRSTILVGRLELVVRNRGRLSTESASTGLGLKNARSRLKLIFGPNADVVLTQDGPWVVGRIIVPDKPAGSSSLHS